VILAAKIEDFEKMCKYIGTRRAFYPSLTICWKRNEAVQKEPPFAFYSSSLSKSINPSVNDEML
jgi:hypothetical protein